MAPRPVSATRHDSPESSATSNVENGGAGASVDDSGSEPAAASTPTTSVSDNRSLQSSKAAEDAPQGAENTRRPRRALAGVGSYNLKTLSDAQLPSPSRNTSGLSGRTLVNNAIRDDDNDDRFREEVEQALKPLWEIPTESPKRKLPPRPTRKPSVADRLKNGVKNASGSVRSVLGKRGRGMLETGKRKLGMQKSRRWVDENEDEEDEEKEASPRKKNKLLAELDMGKGGVLDELDLEAEYDIPAASRPAKRVKTNGKAVLQEIAQPVMTGPLQKTSDGKKVKKWHHEGLYVGQDPDLDSTRVGPKKLKKKRPESAVTDENEDLESSQKKSKLNLGLPMFSYLEKERDFVIPYDVFAPAPGRTKEKPKDWKQINKNRLIGEARDLWDRSERLAQSSCVCQPPDDGEMGCDYDCLNRVMQYECNNDNCNLPVDVCGNRPFQELAERTKKGGLFDVGVEVIKTEQRGHGIRAARSFKPGQIIMEYTGEIISEAECQRRMREDYKDKSCYYLMELERNLVIDGTKGSMARFINHSCNPNCEVRMIKANGIPRMAVFAGDSGIMTGEELTYDYNFDNFGESRQPCYCGANNCRGYLGKRLNATEFKKQQKLDAERKRKAAEMAQKAAEEEQRKKKTKNERGAGWHGWVSVAEVKDELLQQKRLLEEKEKNSSRAQRLAKRRGSLPGRAPQSPVKSRASKTKVSSTRRKTIDVPLPMSPDSNGAGEDEAGEEDEDDDPVVAAKATKELRRTSTGSRFTEDLELDKRPVSRPGSRHSGRSMLKKQANSMMSSMQVQREEDEDVTNSDKLGGVLNGDNDAKASEASSKSTGTMTVDEEEEMPAGEPRPKQEATAAKEKRRSLLATVSDAAKTKWRQTTIGFSRLN